MKLSKKGRERMWDFAGDGWGYVEYGEKEELNKALKEMNFSQEDFKDCVVLTVEEANKIFEGFYDALYVMESFMNFDADEDALSLLRERIEQAEINK